MIYRWVKIPSSTRGQAVLAIAAAISAHRSGNAPSQPLPMTMERGDGWGIPECSRSAVSGARHFAWRLRSCDQLFKLKHEPLVLDLGTFDEPIEPDDLASPPTSLDFQAEALQAKCSEVAATAFYGVRRPHQTIGIALLVRGTKRGKARRSVVAECLDYLGQKLGIAAEARIVERRSDSKIYRRQGVERSNHLVQWSIHLLARLLPTSESDEPAIPLARAPIAGMSHILAASVLARAQRYRFATSYGSDCVVYGCQLTGYASSRDGAEQAWWAVDVVMAPFVAMRMQHESTPGPRKVGASSLARISK